MKHIANARTLERPVSVWIDAKGFAYVADRDPILDVRTGLPTSLRPAPLAISIAAGASGYPFTATDRTIERHNIEWESAT